MSTQTVKKKAFKKIVPEDYLDLINAPGKLFHPYRLLITQSLMLHGIVDFRQLRFSIPEITDGNLASHLGVLERSGYVHCHKEVIKRKLRTSYEITEEGRNAFSQLMDSLKKMMQYE